jgi:hypothetical protein
MARPALRIFYNDQAGALLRLCARLTTGTVYQLASDLARRDEVA